MREQSFSRGELAKSIDITPRSIRFYEEQGLLNPTRIDQSRIYMKKDQVRLKLLLRGKRLGFSLAETKTLFDLYDSNQNSKVQLEAMLKMTDEKRAHMQQQLEDVEARCQEELNALTLHTLKQGQTA